MTIAISLKVNDGVVLASDSASSLMGRDQGGNSQVLNVYDKADKIFNLRKGLPIGAITWGAGSIGNASISTIVKDLRKRFSGSDSDCQEWEIDPESYRIENVAQKFREYVFDDLYIKEFDQWKEKPRLGFVVAGYSSDSGFAEEYKIDIGAGQCSGPVKIRDNADCGATWSGDPEAINRLILGIPGNLRAILQSELSLGDVEITRLMDVIQSKSQVPLVMPAMPMQDAIDLAEFLVTLTMQFSKFNMGAPTVGGPVEIAAISKHEGFKWVKRKHYFDSVLNPSD